MSKYSIKYINYTLKSKLFILNPIYFVNHSSPKSSLSGTVTVLTNIGSGFFR